MSIARTVRRTLTAAISMSRPSASQSNHRCAGAHHAPLRRRLKTGLPGAADLSSSFLSIRNDGPPGHEGLPQSSPYRENLKLGPGYRQYPRYGGQVKAVWISGSGHSVTYGAKPSGVCLHVVTELACQAWRQTDVGT